MASWVFPNVSEQVALEAFLNKSAQSNNPVLKLFKNDVTPDEDTTLGTFTEADFTGYAAKTCTGADWTIADGTASYTQQTIASTEGSQSQVVYGAYVVAGTDLLSAVKFDSSVTITNDEDEIKVTPVITLN